MPANLYDDTVAGLKAAAISSIRCGEFSSLLIGLGFDIRNGGKGKHRIVTHDGVASFYSTSFDCGHGADAIIKPRYIRNMIRTIETYEAELRAYLSGGKK